MDMILSYFKSGSRSSRTIVSPQDEDDSSPDGHDRKALLEGEGGYGRTDSPPPYRSKQKRAHCFTGFAAGLVASTLLFGLLTLCFSWHMTTLKATCAPTEVQDMQQSTKMTTGKPKVIPNPGELEADTNIPASYFEGWKDCGSNVTEARAKGCFFDVMLHSWVHEECFDKDLMDEYLDRVPYKWYRDWKNKEEITVEEMRLGEHGSAAVKLEEHGTHCAYVLEKNIRAAMHGKSMARSIYSVKHAVHCLGLLVNPDTIPGDYTEVVVEYDECGVPHFD